MTTSWSPGIGDPTPLGWLTVLAYLAACAATLRAARRDVPDNTGMWIGISIFLGLLAINKQLDLQTLLTVLARMEALAGGWYENRRAVQQQFILYLLAVSGALMVWLLYATRKRGGALRMAIAGVSILLVFVCVRAVSFHNMDALIGSSFMGVTVNHILEISGIAIVGIAALAVRLPSPPFTRGRISQDESQAG